jgi:hypothetical protein
MHLSGVADLSPISGQFSDDPLTAADFQFSNALETVDPTTGLPPVLVVAPTTTTPVASAGVSGTTLILALALGAAAYFYWPEIKARVESWGQSA